MGVRHGVSLRCVSDIVGSVVSLRLILLLGMRSVLPNPLVPLVVGVNDVVSVIVGRMDGKNSSCAMFACAGIVTVVLLVFVRMTVMSPL